MKQFVCRIPRNNLSLVALFHMRESVVMLQCFHDKIALCNVVCLEEVDRAWSSGLVESLRIVVSVSHTEPEILTLVHSIEKAISSYKLV